MNDGEFLAALESCELPEQEFNHRGHVRAAWLYLGKLSLPEAAQQCALSIQRYANHLGATDKFHLTLTLAWMHIIADLRQKHPADNWEEFAAACPGLFDEPGSLLQKYYREDTLFSDRARRSFVPPDLQALPGTPS